MRHTPIPLHQEQRQWLIRQLLRETIRREDVIREIREILRSILSHAEGLLSDVRQEYLDLSNDSVLRRRYRERVEAFFKQATSIINSLRVSIKRLGDGTEEDFLMHRLERAEALIERTYDMCLLLISGGADVLNG